MKVKLLLILGICVCLVLNITPAALQTIPNFSQGSWPDLYSAPWNAQLAQFWGNK